jgi:hypothetical protein
MAPRSERRRRRTAFRWIVVTTALIAIGATRPAAAQPQPITGLTTTNGALDARAQPDECFIAVGLNIPFARPNATTGACTLGIPKVNQSYLWGMTRAGNKIWFGTTANPQCIAQGAFAANPADLHPYETPSAVCEFGSSAYAALKILPAAIADFRPPQMFSYDITTGVITNVTPTVAPSATNPLGFDPVVAVTRGLRAAATIGNLVMLAGPSLLGGLNFFFYEADTGAYLGTATLAGYDSIRHFVNFEGQLYATVGQNFIPGVAPGGGAVLRWNGKQTAAPCTTSCLSFETVGTLDGIGADLTMHNGRIFVGTWTSGSPDSVAGLWRSPIVPRKGLTAKHTALWKKVWSVTDYEPDRVIAATYATGALASFDGALYWGTMHVPWNATAAWLGYLVDNNVPLPQTADETNAAVVNTFRTAVMFRGRTFGPHGRKHIDLLYGEAQLPVWRPATETVAAHWETVDNNMPRGHRLPLYGLSGFGNAYNNYVWSMAVWNNRLWVGTMDWSHPAEQGAEAIFEAQAKPLPIEISLFFAPQTFGADLFFFQDSRSPAVAESSGGVGNYTNYGIRNMLATKTSLFLGTANPSNLLTAPTGPQGGWELIELTPRVTTPLIAMTEFTCRRLRLHDDDGDGVDEPTDDDDIGSGTSTCVVRISKPAPAGGLPVGVLNLSPNIPVAAPLNLTIPAGRRQVSFTVEVNETAIGDRSRALLIAGFNGGTRIAPLDIKAGRDRDDCERR